jgi:hypothetical protein
MLPMALLQIVLQDGLFKSQFLRTAETNPPLELAAHAACAMESALCADKKTNALKNLRIITVKICIENLKTPVYVYLFPVLRPAQEFFIYKGTSPPVKG